MIQSRVISAPRLAACTDTDAGNGTYTTANIAHSSSLRVVVLAETPLPENLHSDIDLLLRPDDASLDSETVDVLGIVTKSGDLRVVQSLVQRRAAPSAAQHFTTSQRLPQALEV